MQIKRKIDVSTAQYDILSLSHEQMRRLFFAYEKQNYVFRNNMIPDEGDDELFDKLKKVVELSEITI